MDSPQKNPTGGRSAAQLRRQQPAWQRLQQDRSHPPTASARKNQESQSSNPFWRAELRISQAELVWSCCHWPQELGLVWAGAVLVTAARWTRPRTRLGGQGAVPAEPRDVPAPGMLLSTEQEKAGMSREGLCLPQSPGMAEPLLALGNGESIPYFASLPGWLWLSLLNSLDLSL